jgi:hypothetical protein
MITALRGWVLKVFFWSELICLGWIVDTGKLEIKRTFCCRIGFLCAPVSEEKIASKKSEGEDNDA